MTGRAAAFALIGRIESQCDKTTFSHFLCVQSGTLFFDGSKRMPNDQCRVLGIYIHICQHIKVSSQYNIITVLVEYFFYRYLIICYECLWRFRFPFGSTDKRNDFIDLRICQTIIFPMGDMYF